MPRRTRRRTKSRTNTDAFVDGALQGCLKGLSRSCMILFPFVLMTHLRDLFSSSIAFDSPKKMIIALIYNYQIYVSPKLKTECLFEPSCSNYALQAIQKYGLLKGSPKNLLRLLKCNSFAARLYSRSVVDHP